MSHRFDERASDIAVIGMSCRFPHANDVTALWRLIHSGEVTFSDIPKERWTHSTFFEPTDVRAPDKTYVRKGAFIDGVDEFAALHYGLAPRRVQVMDPQQRLAIEATRQALADAGYDTRAYDKHRTGVFIGASVSEYKDVMSARHRALQMASGDYGDTLSPDEAAAVKAAVADVVPIRAFSIAGSLLNMIACSVSQTFDLHGPAMQIDAACSSALVAIHEASVNLRAGVCNLAVAGGVYLNLHPDNLVGFSRIGAISMSGVCRPFDERADGFVMGEGVGLVVLKRYADAVRDGDRIYAVMRGSGCNNDGRGEGPMTPRPEGQIDAMRRAHDEARVSIDSIGYVESHGTATTVGDATEVGALKTFFTERAERTGEKPSAYLGSIKANIGHTMSAAGVAGFIKTCLALHHRTIPPQPGCEVVNPKLELASSPFRITPTPQPWAESSHPRRAAVSSFGFGGTNAHVVLEEAPARVREDEVASRLTPSFSARSGGVRSAFAAQADGSAPWGAEGIGGAASSGAASVARARAGASNTATTDADTSGSAGSSSAAHAVEVTVAIAPRERPELFLISAPTPELLVAHANALADEVEARKLAPADVAKALSTRQAFPSRAMFVATGREALVKQLRQVQPLQAGEGASLAFLFPGQGAQRINLLRDLVERFPQLLINLRSYEAAAGVSIIDALYPTPESDLAAAQAKLTRTEVCQPVMAALGLALNALLTELGVKPSVVLGHSLGEFAAASAAGMLDAGAAVSLVAKRGALMQGLKLADAGAMLAVMASRAAIEPVLKGLSDVWLSNHNHPTQSVLSGTTPGIAAAEKALTAAGLKTARLDVSHAFHSPLVAGIDDAMQALVSSLTLSTPQVPVVSCISGQPYASQVEAAGIWVRHATAPVNFVEALNSCVRAGITDFVQVGAGTALISFARGVAPDAAFQSLAPNDGGDGGAMLLSTLGQLWLKGVPVNARPLFDGSTAQLATLPPTPLETQKYWAIERMPRPARTPATVRTTETATASPKLSLKGKPMDSLIALFQQQNALLQSQAEILKAQATAIAALTNGQQVEVAAPALLAPAPVVHVAASPKPLNLSNLVAPKAEAAPTKPAAESVKPKVVEAVFATVAKISAFPQSTLKAEQTLVGELGFDSLMLVELDQQLGKAFPTLGGLPREVFSKETTLTTVIDYVTKALTEGVKAPAAAAEATASMPLERLAPQLVASPLRSLTETVTRFEEPILITRDSRGISEAVAAKLKAAGIDAVVGDVDTSGTFAGIIHLADLSSTGDYRAPSRMLLRLAKKLSAETAELFVTVTGMGATLGLGAPRAQLGQVGALGFTRALAKEWPDAVVKAIDVDTSLEASAIAQHLVDEITSGQRAVDVGFSAKGRLTIGLSAAPEASKPKSFTKDDVVLITGGAKGLGLLFAKRLAATTGSRIVLAGRTDVAGTTAEVTKAGASACSFQSMNVRDAASVKSALDAVRAKYGRIDVIVHAAGILADALVAKKDGVDAVLETKVGGALALLDAAPEVKRFVGIGSWAGRFGNAAQTDYSAANAMLAQLGHVTIDFPPFENSEMAKAIPAFRKAELKASGVTFLSDDEGAEAFVRELLNGSGEVLVGRGVPESVETSVATFPVSRLNHVYLNDHTMAGQRVLPFAAALDYVAASALETAGAPTAPFTVKDFQLQRAILVPDTTWLEVETTSSIRQGRRGAMRVTLRQGQATSYTGTVTTEGDAAGVPSLVPASKTELPLALKDFYARYTFHGPRLQGITAIDGIDDTGVTGWVKGSTPAEWIQSPARDGWTVDPLIIDASFQLAGYWAWVKQQRAGFPTALGTFVQLKPFGAGPVKCTVRFEASSDDLFTGALVWHDAQGVLLAYMTGTKAEFKKREPQFQTPAAEPATPAVDEATWNPAKFPEYEELQERLQMAEAFGLRNPYFSVHEAICGDTTVVNGKEMINFSSYNYVGNSGNPVVTKAAQDAIAKYGTSVSASRVASGEKPLTRDLELALAGFFGTEDSIVMVSGHATNVTVIGHVVGANDLIVHDALAHDSIIGGAKLSGAKRRPFPHNDFEALDRMLTSLRPHYRRVLICIEGVYSMDGDIPNLPKFIEVKKKHHALLLVDEAHSAGTIGKTGRGIGEYYGVNRADVDMWGGTLSKSFASCGGYIAGSKALVEYLKYTAPGFVYSVGISPPNAAAALASTHEMLAHPERVTLCQENAKFFLEQLKARGINTGPSKDSAVVPAIIGNSVLCLQVSDALKTRGINVQPILYPAVEEDQARLRFFLSSLHKREQLVKTADILKEELERLTRELNSDAVA
ncbi:MAG: aminotransferase class I/II-fold pyridoxal phosphate-dependent enzyme [Archangium sp.]|nr:aminotransferase class I/II-fold pyridoxal phosphate-dependent enzyme [Archangium sp.]